MTYSLVNVVDRARNHPSFGIPSAEARQSLCPGDLAKLVFSFPAQNSEGCIGERMWVRVDLANNGRYSGRLAHPPAFRDTRIAEGDRVEFSSEHVAEIHRKGWR